MSLRLPLALFLIVAAALPAAAQSKKDKSQDMGTPEQRAACGPDVRRYCAAIKPDEGPFAYLSCLQEHREKLRAACVRVIDGGEP